MILVDEAYFHYADSSDYESVIPMIKDHANLIVARTFSKIYGMAGLRCGYGVAQARNDRENAFASAVGQRQHHGHHRGDRESERSRSG